MHPRRAAILKEQASWTKEQWDAEFARIAEQGKKVRTYFPPDNYEAYRNSPLWRRISRRVMNRDGRTCVRCGGRATAVHHRRYTQAVLDGEDDSHLVAICDDCHRTVHYEASGRVRNSWNEGDAILMERPPVTPTTPDSAVKAYYQPAMPDTRSRGRGP